MVKGGYLYEWRTKQLSLLFIFVVSTTFILWSSWGKTPPFTTLLFPAGQVKVKDDDLREAVNLLSPVTSTPQGLASPPSLGDGEGLMNLTSLDIIQGDNKHSNTQHHAIIEDNTTGIVEKSVSADSKQQLVEPKKQDFAVNFISPVTSTPQGLALGDDQEDTEHSNSHHENTTAIVQKSKQQLVEPKKQDLAVGVGVLTPNVENQACNFGKGKWVRDDNRPLYSGFGCKQWLSAMWACRLTQRTDFAYEKLRWHPKECQMDDFSGPNFLKRMQDKTLAFIGDSLGRQQFQSLMCMITAGQERQDVQDVGKEYGLVKARGSVRPDGWAYRFPVTNTTILYYWSASLCNLEPLDPTNKTTYFAMHLDRPPAFLQRYISRFSVVVLNTGHHWNRGKLNANRWVMYVGGKRNTDRKIADITSAKNLTIHSIVKWVNGELPKYPGLKAFYRSISPRHFFNGDWNTGGTCDSSTPGALQVLQNESSDSMASGAVKGTNVKLLDITALSEVREEGHISRYSIRATPGMQDCLHWCLPGIPDTWNELLFAQI